MTSELTAGENSALDERRVTDGSSRAELRPSSLISLRVRRILALCLVVLVSATIILLRERLAGLGAYGYPGLFLINVITSATVILPMPGLALAFAAGASLNPFLVGLAVGSGAAVGELTGYLTGYSGQGLVEDNPSYIKIQSWMHRYGLWVLFGLAVIPNPFFDVAGMISGVLRIPVWRFLLVCWTGNVIKASAIALIGAETIMRLGPLFQHWLAK